MGRIQGAALFFLGGAIGAVGATVALRKKYQQQADREIDEYKKHVAAKSYKWEPTEDIPENQESLFNLDELLEDERYDSREEDISVVNDPRTATSEKVDYTKYSGSVPDDEFEIEAEDDVDEEVDPDRPFIVSVESFFDEYPENTKVTYTYYEEDDVLANEIEQPVDDISGEVGEESLCSFGKLSQDENVVYVRNLRLGSDFEIVRANGAYSELVLGMRPDRKQIYKMRRDDD